ncbi:MAG: cytochrome P450 [Cyanobacteria bacterium J06592_8]
MPFGGGQRSCIGVALAQFEIKLVLATLLSNFELKLAENQPVKPKLQGLLLEPANGVKMVMMGKRMQPEKKSFSIETV